MSKGPANDSADGKKHWSEIDRSAIYSVPSPSAYRPAPSGKPAWAENPGTGPAAQPKKRGGRRWTGLLVVAVIVVGIVVMGTAGYFAYDRLSASPTHAKSEPTTVQALAPPATQVVAEDQQQAASNAKDQLTKRVNAFESLLETIATTGDDKTQELLTFLDGRTEDTKRVAADYQAHWAPSASGAGPDRVIPGTVKISRIDISYGSNAGVLFDEKVKLPDGTTVRCIENTVWAVKQDEWYRQCSMASYWHDAGGRCPLDAGTVVDELAWDVLKVQQCPGEHYAKAGDQVVAVTFLLIYGDTKSAVPADYAPCLWTADGRRHDVSTLTYTLFTAAKEQMQKPMAGAETRAVTLAFEIPAKVDLATLEFEARPRTQGEAGPAATTSDAPDSRSTLKITPHTWALATGAILGEWNHQSEDSLAGLEPTTDYIEAEKGLLSEQWGVENRQDLLDVLQWLKTEGHRKDWDAEAAYLASLSEAQVQHLLAQAKNDPEVANQIETVRKYARDLGTKSILGWDLSRYVALCRWGYMCGYFTEDEAWAHIMPAAAKLQATFSSWQDLGQNYLIGRQFWSLEETQQTGYDIRMVYDSLMNNSTSAWRTLPWDMNLGITDGGTY